MVPLVGLIIFLGVYPQPVLARIAPSVNASAQPPDSETGKHQPVRREPLLPPASAERPVPPCVIREPGRLRRGYRYATFSRFPRPPPFDGQGRVQGDSHGCRSSELEVTGISGSALASPAASPAFAAMNLAAMRGER